MLTLIRGLVACALLPICAIAIGAPVDETLVARFETASAPEEQQQLALQIHQNLGEGPVTEDLKERLIKVLVSRPSLGHSRYTAILEAFGDPGELRAASVNAIAAGLVTDGITHDWPAYQTIRKVLMAYQQQHGLPEKAYSSLKQSLRSERPYWMVVEVLAAMATDDPRHDDAQSAIVDALGEHEHYGIRSAAIAGIEKMANGDSLSERTLSALQRAALSDDYISVRLEAFALLSKQHLGEEPKQILGESLARELTTPTQGLWQRSPSNFSLAERYRRAVELLIKLHEPPYPDHVIDALIMQTKSFAADRSIELLRANRPANGFSSAHRKRLEGVAAQHHNEALRTALFELLAAQVQTDSAQSTLDAFENGKGSTARIAAGHALMNRYRVGEVPGAVIEVADRILGESKDQKLQHVAASLIARGDEPFPNREQRLLASLKSRRDHPSVYHAFVELYGEDRFEDLVVRYVADTSVPTWFRSHAMSDLGQRAMPGATLASRTEEALLQAAGSTSDYRVINAVISALTAWRLEVPMSVYLKAKTTHSNALFGLLVLCALTNLIVCLLVLVNVFKVPLREHARAVKRAAMALGWGSLSVGMLALLAFGVVGFIGHNSAPDPRGTLLFQIPAYIGTVVYLIVAWLIYIWAKKRKAQEQ